MKTLTYWAVKNRKKAIGIMVLLHLVLIFNALYLGKILIEKNIVLNDVFFYTGIGMFVIAYFLYPVRAGKNSLFKYDMNSKVFKYSFFRHKILDTLSSLAAFILIAYTVNISYSEAKFTELFQSEVKAADYQHSDNMEFIKEVLPHSNNEKFSMQIKAVGKTTVMYTFKNKAKSKVRKIFEKDPKTSTDLKFVLKLILVISLSVIASLGLALLSCYILCAGFEVIGILLFVGGLTGLIALSIIFIKKLVRNHEKLIKTEKYEDL